MHDSPPSAQLERTFAETVGSPYAVWPLVRRLAVALILIFPAVTALAYIVMYGENMVFGDEFAIVPLLAAIHAHTLNLPMLAAQHNEERIFFPRLILLSFATLTHFNGKVELFGYWFCLCGVASVLLAAFLRAQGRSWLALLGFVPAAFLVFDLRQSENLLWGFQFCWGLAVLGVVFALWLLATHARAWPAFALAVAAGVVASYSLLLGLFVWPVGVAELLTLDRRRYRLHAALWAVVGIVVAVAYFNGYSKPPVLANQNLGVLGDVAFVYSMLGSPFMPHLPGSVYMGVLFTVLIVWAVFRTLQRGLTPFAVFCFALIAVWVASVLVITYGRTVLGLGYSLASKYTPLGLIGIAALYLLLLQGQRRAVLPVLATLLAIGIAMGYASGLDYGKLWHDQATLLAGYERNFETEPDSQVAAIVPQLPSSWIVEQLRYLKEQRLSVFHGFREVPLVATKPPATRIAVGPALNASIDVVNGVTPSQQGTPIEIDGSMLNRFSILGWAVDSAAGKPASGVYLFVDDTLDVPTTYGLERKDVVNALDNPDYAHVGYAGVLSAAELGHGRHTLSIKIVTADGAAYYEPNYRLTLDVR
jgi:hypothetical protein